eukprot:TRINITY_DN15082_c0_g1_i1.p1 TRINITY_DN15082_c0_g1~~TRINITY_DN15082_c0_g1_i1.p1  ORF type:complete len:273 (-),score=100.36 TRINITY_DN15082_c0_g1_i1:144-962(-)
MEKVPKGGFNFDLYHRNNLLSAQGQKLPKFKKTGTTICGIICGDHIILGADTRATEGPIVCDKNCEKIHYISENIYCCGAGTAADTENITGLISSQLELHSRATGRQPRVVTALTMLSQRLFQYQGHISAALVLGGVDSTGPHLHTVYPHGSITTLPYVTMGSGSLAAMSIFEAGYRSDLTLEEGIDLVCEAICAGIFNDLGSGGNVDICVINEKEKADFRRNYKIANPRKYQSEGFIVPPGTTEILSETITKISSLVDIEEIEPEDMDVIG